MQSLWASVTVIDRLWEKTQITDGCWEWTGRIAHNGYGRIWVERSTKPAHRVAYEHLIGPVPDGLELDHLCRNKRCVNPDHLEPVTHAENCRRADIALGIRSAITHCSFGHEFTNRNTAYRARKGAVHRVCRKCTSRRTTEYRRRKRVAVS